MKKIFVFILTVFAVLSFSVSCVTPPPAETPPPAAQVTHVETPPLAVVQLPPQAQSQQPDLEPQLPVVQESRDNSLKLGNFNIYTLVDSERDGDVSIIPGASEAILNRYIPASGFRHSTNAFLIKANGQNILVDTGFGNTLLEKLEELGIAPEQINVILLTHMHGDHIGGLVRDGRPVFPRAKIYVNTIELDHFTRVAPSQGALDVMNAYRANIETFHAHHLGFVFREVYPGIRAIASYGHTPGHTAFMIVSGRERLIIAGDFLHVALVQFPHPEISATFDMDQNAAAASRRHIMEYAARRHIPVAGMHIPYPGIGYVETDGHGFKFTPIR